jgi:hypothetical protein
VSIAEKSASMFDNPMTQPLCPLRDGEHAPQRPAEKQPIEVTSAGTRPVLPCIVCVSTTRYRRHHGNVVGACMHSPCNLGLSPRLSYITKGWFGIRYVDRTYPCFCIAAGYSRSRSVCRASFLRRMDAKREMSGSTSYLHTMFLFAQRTHEGRTLSHYLTVRPHLPYMCCKQLTRLCFLPLTCNTSDPNLSPSGLWCGIFGLLTQSWIQITELQPSLTR